MYSVRSSILFLRLRILSCGFVPHSELNMKITVIALQVILVVVVYNYSVSYWAIQRSWFARVNALCNLSRKKSREVAAHFRADF